MTEPTIDVPSEAAPPRSAIDIAHLVYGLHALAIAVGIAGSATVVGSFLGSLPSIAGVVLNYVKRRDARGTWLDSHYRWQIRTFWYALAWAALAGLFILTFVGIPFGIAVLVPLTLWLVYRVARGWLRLRDAAPMYT